MKKLFNFLTYNNAVPITITLLVLGAGSAYAATNPDTIINSTQTVKAVDNTYIANADLPTWNFQLKIDNVTEDTDSYTVSYEYQTIQLVQYAWQPTTIKKTFTVSKKEVQGIDLGVFVSKQLSEVITSELAYLNEVQQDERTKGVTQEVVATAYSGLIGKFLDPKEETFAGYTPVIAPADNSQSAAVAGAGSSSGSSSSNNGGSSNNSGGQSTTVSMQLLGNNPAIVPLGIQYSDLGVVVLDTTNANISHEVWVDGAKQNSVVIDTSSVGVHTVEYRAVDSAGTPLLVRRIVMVGTTNDPGGEINSAGNVVVGTVSAPPPETPDATSTPPETPPAETPPADTPPDTSSPSETPPDDTATTTAPNATPPADDSQSTSTPS